MSETGQIDNYIVGLSDFVAASPTSYHAAHEVARQLVAAGFALLSEGEVWGAGGAGAAAAGSAGARDFGSAQIAAQPGPASTAGTASPASPAGYVVVRDGAVIAWRVAPDAHSASPVRVLGAHTDSPSFKLAPKPDFEREGWAQASVEIYGGPLLNSWLDRDLEFAGRLVLRDGREVLARTGAIARIPQLAVHLDRDVNSGLTLNKQKHVQPVLGVDLQSTAAGGAVIGLLAKNAGVDPAAVAGHDVFLAHTQRAERLGADRGLFASGRLDNLSSVYAALTALLATTPAPGTISMLAAFDHEELGSQTRSGASGPFLADVLTRIYTGLGADASQKAVAINNSWCLSADAGHSVHPNYPEKHDPIDRPIAGRGVALKVNAQQRYATDAHGAALFAKLGELAGVKTQVFVCNNEIPCGSTIGPLTATKLGMRTLDAGVPLLSMHSVRELAHVRDLYELNRLVAAFFERQL